MQTLTGSLERIPIAFNVKKSLLIVVCLRSCVKCVTELLVYPVYEMFWKEIFLKKKIKCCIFQMKIQPHSVLVSETEI